MRRGIPDSLDQLEMKRKIFFASLALVLGVLLFATLFWWTESGNDDAFEQLREAPSDDKRQESLELPLAHEAARKFVLAKLNSSGIDSVKWRDARHEGHSGWYRIDGFIEIVDIYGDMHTMFYIVTVSRRKDKSWEMGELKLTPIEKQEVDDEVEN